MRRERISVSDFPCSDIPAKEVPSYCRQKPKLEGKKVTWTKKTLDLAVRNEIFISPTFKREISVPPAWTLVRTRVGSPGRPEKVLFGWTAGKSCALIFLNFFQPWRGASRGGRQKRPVYVQYDFFYLISIFFEKCWPHLIFPQSHCEELRFKNRLYRGIFLIYLFQPLSPSPPSCPPQYRADRPEILPPL